MADFNLTKISRSLVLAAMLGLLTLGAACAPGVITSGTTGNRSISAGGTTFFLPDRWKALAKSEQQYWRISADDVAFYSPVLAHKAMGRFAFHSEPYITVTRISDPATAAHIKKMAADHSAFKQHLQHEYDTKRPRLDFRLRDMRAPVRGRGVSYTFVHNDPFRTHGEKMYVIVTHIFGKAHGIASLTYVDFEDFSREGKTDYDTMLPTFAMEQEP